MAFACFLFTFRNTMNIIQERRAAFERLQANEEFQAALQQIPEYISEDSGVTILWCYNEYDYGGPTEALLPFSTHSRHPILYTSNIVDPTATPEARFKLHHKLKVDYVLSRQAAELPSLQEIHANRYYHFYKIMDVTIK